jgi:hypothetical protein
MIVMCHNSTFKIVIVKKSFIKEHICYFIKKGQKQKQTIFFELIDNVIG